MAVQDHQQEQSHRVVACYPEEGDRWARFDGGVKPLHVSRSARPAKPAQPGARADRRKAALAASPVHVPGDRLLKLLLGLRGPAVPAATFSLDGANVAMITPASSFCDVLLARVLRNRANGRPTFGREPGDCLDRSLSF
jgi:hypothetical protein